MRLVTVGTGTVVPDPERASACHWVETGDTRVILDCGAGAVQGLARAGLPWAEVGHLVVSHFHADHITEIPALVFALRHALPMPRTTPLEIWGPVGTRRLFDAWAAAMGSWLTEPGFGLPVRELVPGRAAEIGELRIEVAPTPHTEESLALRLEDDRSALGYTGDTGPDPALAEFFRGVDLLLAECSLPDDLVGDNHLSPGRLARLAAAAGVTRLVVTHVYPQLRGSDVPALIRRAGFEGEVIMARDGLEIRV
jgi:ribonuclease BN (tRNA processing enzyme)